VVVEVKRRRRSVFVAVFCFVFFVDRIEKKIVVKKKKKKNSHSGLSRL